MRGKLEKIFTTIVIAIFLVQFATLSTQAQFDPDPIQAECNLAVSAELNQTDLLVVKEAQSYKVSVSTITSSGTKNVLANIYRRQTTTNYETAKTNLALTQAPAIDFSNKWTLEFSDSPSNPGIFPEYLVIVKAQNPAGAAISKCVKFVYSPPALDFEKIAIEWFKNDAGKFKNMRVNISEGANEPPFIIIPETAGSIRPELKMKLFHVHGSGSGTLTENQEWLIFKAYYNKDVGSFKQGDVATGIYLVGDDDGPNWSLYYSSDESSMTSGKFSPGGAYMKFLGGGENDFSVLSPSGVPKLEGAYERLFAYMMNIPEDYSSTKDTNCVDGFTVQPVIKTGPNEAKKTLEEAGFDGEIGRTLNGNCINIEDSGWLKHWGVGVSSEPLEQLGDCGFTYILGNDYDKSGNTDISDWMNNLIQCIYDKVFEPIIQWAVGLIEYAAGISYINRPSLVARNISCVV